MLGRMEAKRVLRELQTSEVALSGMELYRLTLLATDDEEQAQDVYRNHLAAQLAAGLAPR